MSDHELANGAKHDVQFFSELFDRYFERVYQFHLFRIRQDQDAEDLTSETFTKVFQKIDTFREDGAPFSAWLFTIARNTLIDFTRKHKIKPESIDEIQPSDEPSKDFDMTKIENTVLSDKLWEAIRTLPEKQQQLWGLKLSADLPHRDIAEILGTTENNVNVMVNRSLKQLKRYLSFYADA